MLLGSTCTFDSEQRASDMNGIESIYVIQHTENELCCPGRREASVRHPPNTTNLIDLSLN